MKTNKIIILSIATAIIGLTTFTGCKEEELPDVVNEEELITTISLAFENTLTGEINTFSFRDIDGPGGAAPSQFDTIRLLPDGDYTVLTTLLNESVTPAEDITVEVAEEGVDHQFFYTVSAGLNLTLTYNDTDANGDPIGIANIAATGAESNGTITVVLKHQPDIKDGNSATGDTDIEVVFVVEIE